MMTAIDQSQDMLKGIVWECFAGSQGFRAEFELYYMPETKENRVARVSDAWKKDPFLQALSHLAPGGPPPAFTALQSGSWQETMDRMQPLLQNPENKNRLTDSLVFAFDDLLLLSEIKRALKRQQPEYFVLQRFMFYFKTPPRTSSTHLAQLEEAVANFELTRVRTSRLSHSKDAYSEKASRNNKERLGKAEDELDRIWATFEEAAVNFLGDRPGKRIRNCRPLEKQPG